VTHGRIDYLAANQAAWTARADSEVLLAQRAWSSDPSWGIFHISDDDVGVFSGDLDGVDAVELGCGTGYISAWLAQRGARPVGVDPTASQLGIARRMQSEHELPFPLILAAGEQVPLRDESFDLVISEYGAAIWADPYRWIVEAARLLRPGGELIFLCNGLLLMLCVPDVDEVPASDRLLRPQFGMHRVEWPDDNEIEFHLPHGDWIRLLRTNGFDIEDLIELRPAEGAKTSYPFVTVDWARQWPCEEIWRARKH